MKNLELKIINEGESLKFSNIIDLEGNLIAKILDLVREDEGVYFLNLELYENFISESELLLERDEFKNKKKKLIEEIRNLKKENILLSLGLENEDETLFRNLLNSKEEEREEILRNLAFKLKSNSKKNEIFKKLKNLI